MIDLFSSGTTPLETENLQFDGAQLSVNSLRDIYAGLDHESCRPRAIQVLGLHQNASTETLRLLFENRRTCGGDGGEIEDLDFDAEEGVAVIVYKDADSEYIEDLYLYLPKSSGPRVTCCHSPGGINSPRVTGIHTPDGANSPQVTVSHPPGVVNDLESQAVILHVALVPKSHMQSSSRWYQ